MPKYQVTMTVQIEVEAENVVVAHREAKRVRALGAGQGGFRFGPHEKHLTRYTVAIKSVEHTLPERIP